MNNFEENNTEQTSEDSQPWLMTYADMMTLLFAFFVLLYSMSSPDPVKMSAMEDAIAKEAGIEGELKSQNEIKEEIEEIIEDMDLHNVANVIKGPKLKKSYPDLKNHSALLRQISNGGRSPGMGRHHCFGSFSPNIKS